MLARGHSRIYLALLWFGECPRWDVDPHEWLPPASRHLVEDFVRFLPGILTTYAPAQGLWHGACNPLLQRVLDRVSRAL
jgi:hypothetical protein